MSPVTCKVLVSLPLNLIDTPPELSLELTSSMPDAVTELLEP